MQHRRFLLALPLALALLGCPGSLEDPGRFDGQFGECPDIDMLIAKTCAKVNCHAKQNPMSGLDLASADIIMRYSGKKALGGGGLLIDPAHPAESVLYTKITDSPPFGSQMPLTGGHLDASTQSCFLTWLQDGIDGKTP